MEPDRLVMLNFTIYLDPTDPGSGYTVREVRIGGGQVDPGPVLGRGLETLDAARLVVPGWADSCLPRDPDDDPTIVETWI